jgi:ribonuclease HI
LFYDGAKCKNGAGLVVLVSPEGDTLRYTIQINFTNLTPTNNIVEFEGLLAQNPEHWLMFYDGAKCKNGTRLVVLVSPEGDALRYTIQINFTNLTLTNNIIEFEGLLTGLRIAISLGIQRLLVKGDSEVVTQQASKGY